MCSTYAALHHSPRACVRRLTPGPCHGRTFQNVSGQFLHKRLIAIMGPSGAGKTTLLRVLSGRLSVESSNVKGKILVNGRESSILKYRAMVGYVPQDDVMLTNLTVKENIRYSALTRLPRDWTRNQKLARANDVIRLLELENVRCLAFHQRACTVPSLTLLCVHGVVVACAGAAHKGWRRVASWRVWWPTQAREHWDGTGACLAGAFVLWTCLPSLPTRLRLPTQAFCSWMSLRVVSTVLALAT